MAFEDLKAYVEGTNGQVYDRDDLYIGTCWDTAVVLVQNAVGDAEVPLAVLERAFLVVGAELYGQRQAPNGIAQLSTYDGSAVRVARDPLVAAWPLIRPYVGPGLA